MAKEPIMRVAAYHSTNQSDPDVHHDDSNCPVGKQIPEGRTDGPAASAVSDDRCEA